MFRNRRSSQKPNEELINTFKRTFPNVVSVASSDCTDAITVNPAAVESALPVRPVLENEDVKPSDHSPRAVQDFRFTPSFLDPNSFSFMSLANQLPGYYTLTPGGIFHHQAGDLHTPNLGSNLVNPLCIPNGLPDAPPADPSADINMHNFPNRYISHPFHNINPFSQQTSYGPSAFVHRDSGYDPMDRSSDDTPLDGMKIQVNRALNVVGPPSTFSEHMDLGSVTDGEKFRYNVTLRAPTAMIKQADEIPVTYLNKGQAYSISVTDTSPPRVNSNSIKYRTYIRVSFEDGQQRAKPATCWQLWKEGRGSNEAHQRGGKLLAVEYIDPIQGGDDEHRHPQIDLESASFDGFCVTWTPNPTTGATNCAISVRFNFLSTDFSHSKGVKGIPVRLCAKTEVLSANEEDSSVENAEVCYCKVKLFRDHGAERKLSNDVAHVKKTIEKLKQQIAQIEMGGANFGKRKRSSGSLTLKSADNRPVKVPKHKRTWSIDSQTDGPGKISAEDLHVKLAVVQDMFSSTRPVSVLNLRGDEHDDPDLYPVTLPGEMRDFKFQSFSCQSTRGSVPSIDTNSNALSPTNSSMSLNSPHHPVHRRSSAQHPNQRDDGTNWPNASTHQSAQKTSHQPVKIQRLPMDGSTTSTGHIEAVDIDPTYRPPAERPPKPIACFYVRFPSDHLSDGYYRAVYLSERTVRDFMHKISEKNKIDPERITRVLRVNQDGLKIMVDDDVVRELPEGQDMVAEFSEASKLDGVALNINSPPSAVEVKLKY